MESQQLDDTVYDIDQFCDHVAKVSRPTFYRWMAKKGLKKFSTHIGRKWRITARQYAAWIESRAGIHDGDSDD